MKLPDINHQRRVPQKTAGKAAALPNQLRNISAGVSAARSAAQVISTEIETYLDNEAKTSSVSLFNQARREAQQETYSLVQSYHNDMSKDPAMMMIDLAVQVEDHLRVGDQQAGQCRGS